MQNYGQAYKAILNEKFGDGIMSAIAFSTKVEKEVDDKGVEWAVITLRGKWCVSSDPPALGYSGFADHFELVGCHTLVSRESRKKDTYLE